MANERICNASPTFMEVVVAVLLVSSILDMLIRSLIGGMLLDMYRNKVGMLAILSIVLLLLLLSQ